jgi:predicted nuclease with RNAse H fold
MLIVSMSTKTLKRKTTASAAAQVLNEGRISLLGDHQVDKNNLLTVAVTLILGVDSSLELSQLHLRHHLHAL